MANQRDDRGRSDMDMAGYDRSQRHGQNKRYRKRAAADQDNRSGTYRDRDHDGGWDSQVGMDDYRDRSGGDAYERMSRGYNEDSYGRGREGGSTPFDRGSMGSSADMAGRYRWSDNEGRSDDGPGGFYRGGGRGRDYTRRDRDDNDRGFMDRAGDEIKSWFGDDDAERRREEDHRGKGPKGYKRSDERIIEDVNHQLTDDSMLDASNITVAIQDAEITLSGTVPSKYAKRRAEDCADRVSGVQHVQNNLRVAPRTPTGTTPTTV